MKYKNIKSAAHNFGHSFLSDMNAVYKESSYIIIPRLLFQTAAHNQVTDVHINFTNQTIEPKQINTAEINEAVENYSRRLPDLLISQNIDPKAIVNTSLSLKFDYDKTRRCQCGIDEEIQEFVCLVEMTDDRGIVHRASPNNWWME